MKFSTWLDTLIKEKGLDLDHIFEVEGKLYGINYIPFEVLIDAINNASESEQTGIKNMLVAIDFRNGDVMDYFKHLSKALAI